MKLMKGRVLGEVNLQFLTYVMYICCQKDPSQSHPSSQDSRYPPPSSKPPPEPGPSPQSCYLGRNQSGHVCCRPLPLHSTCSLGPPLLLSLHRRTPTNLTQSLQCREQGAHG